MRKVGQILLTGTILSGAVSLTATEMAQAEPLRLAQATCPQGQVGTPPNCKPAPPHAQPQKPTPPPQQHPAPPPQPQHAAPPQPQHAPPPQQHATPPQPQHAPPPPQPQHAPPPPQQHATPPQPQHAPPPQQHAAPPQPQPQQHAAPPQPPQQHAAPPQPPQHAAPSQPPPQQHAAPPQPPQHATPQPPQNAQQPQTPAQKQQQIMQQLEHKPPQQPAQTPPPPKPVPPQNAQQPQTPAQKQQLIQQQEHKPPQQPAPPQPQPAQAAPQPAQKPVPPQNAQQPLTPAQKQQQIIQQLEHKPPQQPAPSQPQPAQAAPPQPQPQQHAAPPQNAQQPLTPAQKQQQIIQQLQHKPPQQPARTQPPQPTQPAQVQPPVPPQQPAQTPPQQPAQPAQVQPPVPPQQPAQAQPQQPQQPANAQPQAPGTPAKTATQPGNTPSAVIAPPWCNPRPGTVGCSLPPSMQKPIEPKRNGPPAIVVITDKGEIKTIGQLHNTRTETKEGDFTIIREPDRTIWVDKKGQVFIQHDDINRFRYGARDVRVDRRGDETLSTIWLPNGERVVTTFDARGRMLRRSRVLRDGSEIVLIDQRPQAFDYDYVVNLPPPKIRIPRDRYIVNAAVASEQTIYDALMAAPVEALERPYSLDEIRQSVTVRERMPSVDVDTINFELGSWEVEPGQVGRLAAIADVLKRALTANPREIFLIEGHTDAVGNDIDNMSLSDRRAETVALILSQRNGVPAENLVTQGYGRQFPLIQSAGAERRNRRVTVRRITPLLVGAK